MNGMSYAVETQSDEQEKKDKISLPIGYNSDNTVILTDLEEMQHMFVAGFMGVGKSSFIQSLLTYAISHYPSNVFQMIIIDTKAVDYIAFQNAPHMLMKLISSDDEISGAINWIYNESKERMKTFAENGIKNINSYNDLCKKRDMPIKNRLVIVIDDFSMLNLDKSQSNQLIDILINGRITGIHCIFATSVLSNKSLKTDFLPHISTRVSFCVNSKSDSYTVLSEYGAEVLRVPGQMIYKSNAHKTTCDAIYIPYEHTKLAVETMVAQEGISLSSIADKAVAIFKNSKIEPSKHPKRELDPLFIQAAQSCIEQDKASIGYFQRKFKIGFNRAAIIMDQLCEAGIVSVEEGTMPRRVLMNMTQFEKALENGEITDDTASFVRHAQDQNRDSVKKHEEHEEKNMHSLPKYKFGSEEIKVINNTIEYTVPVMTRLGPGHLTPQIPGAMVEGIIYKAPSIFRKGYIKFIINDNANIINYHQELLEINANNVEELTKIEFSKEHDKKLYSYISQIAKDLGLRIEEV